MPSKIGSKHNVNPEESPRHYEYYQCRNTSLTIEECEELAKKFRKSCCSSCIEYWEKKYPEKSKEELEEMLKEHKRKRKINNPNTRDYWAARYSNLSDEEIDEKWHAYTKESDFRNKEYWIKRFSLLSDEEITEMWQESLKNYVKSLPSVAGENNPMYRSKHTEQERKECSPLSIEFYKKRGLSDEDALVELKKTQEKASKNRTYTVRLDYYLDKGMTYEEAVAALQKRQATGTIERYIERYGEEEGTKRFIARQEKWVRSLRKNFSTSGNSNLFSSKISNAIFMAIQAEIPTVEEEYLIIDTEHTKSYFYDIRYNTHLIEVNGDYWHCNPQKYDSTYYNKSKKKTAAELWQYDTIKTNFAIRNGYKVKTVWESDYNNNPDKVILECIKFLKDA